MHVSPLCHLAMIAWPIICLAFFAMLRPRKAACLLCVLGYCFLPQVSYDLPGPFDYSKDTAIGIGLIIGLVWGDRAAWNGLRFSWIDIPIAVWCFVPVFSSLSNALGIYDGLANALSRVTTWGACYLVGRALFQTLPDFLEAFEAVVIGGLLYVPLCMFEMRMSPRLNEMLYGFQTQTMFMESYRYGGWRPGVFMNHGITTALWMGTAAVSSLILWLFARRRTVLGIPLIIVVVILFPTFLFSRSAGAWIVMAIVIAALGAATYLKNPWPFAMLLGVIPIYLVSRVMESVDLSWWEELTRPWTLRMMLTFGLLMSIAVLLCIDRSRVRLRFAFAIVPVILTLSLLLLPLNSVWLIFAGTAATLTLSVAARAWWPTTFMLLAIPVYHLDLAWVLDVTGVSFGADRAGSLLTRITNENAMIEHILTQPILGWGGGGRWLPSGEDAPRVAIDSFWPVPLGTGGIVGLTAVYLLIVGLPIILALSHRGLLMGRVRGQAWAGLVACLATLTAGALYTLSAGYTFPLYPLLLGGVGTVLAEHFARRQDAPRFRMVMTNRLREFIPKTGYPNRATLAENS